MGKRKGLAREIVCDIESPILKYQISGKEDEILRDKTHIKFWKRGLRRKGFSRHLKAGLKKELKKFKTELKRDKQDLIWMKKKLRKCM